MSARLPKQNCLGPTDYFVFVNCVVSESLGVSCSNLQKLQLFKSHVSDGTGDLEEALPEETILLVWLFQGIQWLLALTVSYSPSFKG